MASFKNVFTPMESTFTVFFCVMKSLASLRQQ
jgi:hypothetical protein